MDVDVPSSLAQQDRARKRQSRPRPLNLSSFIGITLTPEQQDLLSDNHSQAIQDFLQAQEVEEQYTQANMDAIQQYMDGEAIRRHMEKMGIRSRKTRTRERYTSIPSSAGGCRASSSIGCKKTAHEHLTSALHAALSLTLPLTM